MKNIIVSMNDSSFSWMNNAALDDFDKLASKIWEKWFWNSSECFSVNEWLNMMRFIWKESWMNDDAQWLKKKNVWNEIQSSTKKMRFCLLIWLIF